MFEVLEEPFLKLLSIYLFYLLSSKIINVVVFVVNMRHSTLIIT